MSLRLSEIKCNRMAQVVLVISSTIFALIIYYSCEYFKGNLQFNYFNDLRKNPPTSVSKQKAHVVDTLNKKKTKNTKIQ